MVFKYRITNQNSTFTGLILLLICTTVILVLIPNNSIKLTEARYLPTRADETDIEVLKNIIKGLLNQQHQLDNPMLFNNLIDKHNKQQKWYDELSSAQMEKRSLEMPMINNGGDPDTRLPSS